jgi:hypothetical protein
LLPERFGPLGFLKWRPASMMVFAWPFSCTASSASASHAALD